MELPLFVDIAVRFSCRGKCRLFSAFHLVDVWLDLEHALKVKVVSYKLSI